MRSQIEKTQGIPAPTDSQMEQINRFTRRELAKDEVYVFSLILCDNELDRDGECFPRASLEILAGLFVGKTGVFDHSPKAKNQSARIFDTALEESGTINSLGEEYCCLRAWAYMLRTQRNAELIQEIDGGIKKEVSVGCAVERIVCSVCGADQKTAPCSHQKGAPYDGALCYHRLEHPTDAYEWSFVAVPAQVKAGVTKRVEGAISVRPASLAKLFEQEGDVLLPAGELRRLKAQYTALLEQADAGDHYLSGLRREVVKLAGLAHPSLSPSLSEKIAASLDAPRLEELCAALSNAAKKHFPLAPQIAPETEDRTEDAACAFRI